MISPRRLAELGVIVLILATGGLSPLLAACSLKETTVEGEPAIVL